MHNRRNKLNREIDLGRAFKDIVRNAVPILLAGIIGVMLGALFGIKAAKPVFSATTSIYVMTGSANEKGTSAVGNDNLEAGALLTKDYEEIIKSSDVMNQVISDLGLDMDEAGLRSMITVTVPADTRLIYISASAGDPYKAADIANAVRSASAMKIRNLTQIRSIRVVSSAEIPKLPSGMSLKKCAVYGGAAGLLIAIIIVFVISVMNDTIRTPEDVEKYLGAGTLCQIPEFPERRPRRKPVRPYGGSI
ncbi:MAG: YveK family protein [Chordicoccus sp.]